ncbi:hypothetical protein A5647_11360 [Mycobacterium sp. 1100029.7]|nr:hypothetical protein A5647_11360 [Mycobacterium sp. 1100029.7]
MGLAKPTGGYAEQMLDPGGWPAVDEQTFYDRAQQYTQVLRQVTDVLQAGQSQRAEIFDGGVWSGRAAGAANGEFGRLVDELVILQNGLATVITWHKYVAQTVLRAKSDVTDNVVEGHRTINALETDPTLDDAERTEQINAILAAAHGANVSIIEGTAAQILVSKSWKPPANALQELLDQKTPPPVVIPDGPAVPPSPGPRPRPTPAAPAIPGTGGLTPPAKPGTGGATPLPVTPGTGGSSPAGVAPLDGIGVQPNPGTPGGSRPLTPVGPGPAAPVGGPATSLSPAAPAVPLNPADGVAPSGAAAGGGRGVAPAAAGGPGVLPASAIPTEESNAAAHGGGAGMPIGPAGSGATGGSSSVGRGGPSGAAGEQKPTDKSSSTRPASSTRASNKGKPRAQQPTHADRGEVADVVVAIPIVPVSAARAERDAVADAAKADASRRAGPDALQMAGRIGAALNAPDVAGGMDLGFFWVTGVTTDGLIVVANSYGLAYIPEDVQLPEQVHMASADETIPAAERARWATYPVLAVQGWAAHHDKDLRAVIGTEEQLANSDAGVATIVLKPDDIPNTGDMTGRPRLQVVDCDAAERLAATADSQLAELLPPAPAGSEPANPPQPEPTPAEPQVPAPPVAPATATVRMGDVLAQLPLADVGTNTVAPDDDRFILWFEVMKPLASSAAGRQGAHLQAFQAYTVHAAEVLLREAHSATEPAEQRHAVADWMYWTHLAGLLETALGDLPALNSA